MRKWILTILAAAAGGCATSQPSPPVTAETAANPARWATRQECQQLVDHLDKIVFLNRQVSPARQYPAFLAPEQDPRWWERSVDQCTITVTRSDYECLMRANDTRTADQCYQRTTEY
jgi:hypothetical protein